MQKIKLRCFCHKNPWMIHLSECGGEVTIVSLFLMAL